MRAGRRGQDQRGAGVRLPSAGARSGWPGSSPPRTRRCWRPGSASWPPSLAPGTSGDPVASVHGVLAASPAPWLLVFDNAPDRAAIARFLPPAGAGRVLITSRNQIWPPGQALDVPVLDPEVAAEFLVSRTGDPDRQAARELADELGGLPLALEQAAAYIQATGAAWPVTWPCSASDGRTAGPGRADRVRRDGGDHLGAGVRAAAAGRAGRGRPATAAGVLRARGNPAAAVAATPPRAARHPARRWCRCWCRCWKTRWRQVMRSRRCAGIRWSPWPRTGRCRCTGWCRPSPPTRCPAELARHGGRPPPP